MTMQFNSYPFIFYFLPVCAIGFYALGRLCQDERNCGRARSLWLIAFSVIFYSQAGLTNAGYLALSGIIGYFLQNMILSEKDKHRSGRIYLVIGCIFYSFLLLWFKYAGLFVGHTLTLPLAVSFYSFQLISFLADTYKGEIGRVGLIDYLLYLLYFPRILQGPIVRYNELRAEFDRLGKVHPDAERILRALILFSLGLCKKVLIADTLGKGVEWGYSNAATVIWLESVVTVLSYPLQLYFDFSGYCDMGMAVSRILGIELPVNFDKPYLTTNPADFWRRWHGSLSRFLTTYVYIPLGGSRKGMLRTCRNALIIFMISGIWHGSTIGFLIWGFMHGVLYMIYAIIRERFSLKEKAQDRHLLPLWIRSLPMFLYWTLSMIFFRAPSMTAAMQMLRRLFSKPWLRMNPPMAETYRLNEFWYLLKMLHISDWTYSRYICMWGLLLVCAILMFSGRTADELSRKVKLTPPVGVAAALLFVWGVISTGVVSTFVYFNF